MLQLLIYASQNKYSHAMSLIRSDNSMTYPEEALPQLINDHKDAFNHKNFIALHVLLLKVDVKDGSVEILENSYGEHPLAVRLELNPEAAKRAATPKRKASPAPLYVAPGEIEPMPVLHDHDDDEDDLDDE